MTKSHKVNLTFAAALMLVLTIGVLFSPVISGELKVIFLITGGVGGWFSVYVAFCVLVNK